MVTRQRSSYGANRTEPRSFPIPASVFNLSSCVRRAERGQTPTARCSCKEGRRTPAQAPAGGLLRAAQPRAEGA